MAHDSTFALRKARDTERSSEKRFQQQEALTKVDQSLRPEIGDVDKLQSFHEGLSTILVMLVIHLTIASWACSETLLLKATCKILDQHAVVSCVYLVFSHSFQLRGCARSKEQVLMAVERQI